MIQVLYFQHSEGRLVQMTSIMPGDRVLIPRKKRRIHFEFEKEPSKLLRGQILETSPSKLTVRLLDCSMVEEYERNCKAEVYKAIPEVFDDDQFPVFAVR